MKCKNKIYTKSYFRKRLLEAGFSVKDPDIKYDPIESRYWTLIVESKNEKIKNIIITCFKITGDNYWFNFQTEKNQNFKLYTKSMEIVEEQLDNFFEPPK